MEGTDYTVVSMISTYWIFIQMSIQMKIRYRALNTHT